MLRGDLACTRFRALAALESFVLSAGFAFLGARDVQGSLASSTEYGPGGCACVCVCVYVCVQDGVINFSERRPRAFHALYLTLLQRSNS